MPTTKGFVTVPTVTEPEGCITVPAALIRHARVVAFRVRGDELSGDDIRDGDYLLVDPGQRISAGGLAVVRDGERAVIKRAHRDMGPFRPDGPVFIGKVIGSVRLLADPPPRAMDRTAHRSIPDMIP